ncbi:MAG: nucleotidyl transferase AbiEii/AbiGii toxin family protein [Candidatus Competibacter sp.]|nr:nucleotidyl transferase AbiEii/AbiGii toxin family protein [Candidatus Competibacter sp.]
MTLHFSPCLDILPPPQRRLWPELAAVPLEFVLYGGTAIALYLGHRLSVDFDFFGDRDFDPDQLLASIRFLADGQILQKAKNTLTGLVDRDGPVQISFFGVPTLARLVEPVRMPDNGVRIASLIDLAGMKAAVVQKRAEAKDYIDMDKLITAGAVSLPTALAAGQAIYGRSFNPQITLKALSYFEDGNLKQLPDDLKTRLAMAARAVDLDRLPTIDFKRGQIQ